VATSANENAQTATSNAAASRRHRRRPARRRARRLASSGRMCSRPCLIRPRSPCLTSAFTAGQTGAVTVQHNSHQE